jgi:hypothetical protein
MLRKELALAERELRERAKVEAVRLARLEHEEWLTARDECLQLEQLRRSANTRLKAMSLGRAERFCGEPALAQMALRDIVQWGVNGSAAYTIISFANRYDRLRYLRNGVAREAILAKTMERGGVYTDAFGGRHFMEIVR